MEQLIPWLVFCLLFLALCLRRPKAARIFIGVFFIVMAVGVNWLLSLAAPSQFVALGTSAPLVPFYAWVFEKIVAIAPEGVGVLAAAVEAAIGLLILGRGPKARWGLALGSLFLLAITPLGVWTLPNPLMAAGMLVLASRPYPESLLDRIHARRAVGQTSAGVRSRP
jgi:hypothetical protein